MSKIAALLNRKPAAPSGSPTDLDNTPIDVDEELFSTIGAELGGNNELLRNLLLNANAKIGELDGIKNAVTQLVAPVSKALREFETEKAEKINLQAALSATRTAYGKLRNEVTELERKAVTAERDAGQLRKDLAFAENAARALETVRGELAIDLAGRKAQLADLEGRLNQETAENALVARRELSASPTASPPPTSAPLSLKANSTICDRSLFWSKTKNARCTLHSRRPWRKPRAPHGVCQKPKAR